MPLESGARLTARREFANPPAMPARVGDVPAMVFRQRVGDIERWPARWPAMPIALELTPSNEFPRDRAVVALRTMLAYDFDAGGGWGCEDPFTAGYELALVTFLPKSRGFLLMLEGAGSSDGR